MSAPSFLLLGRSFVAILAIGSEVLVPQGSAQDAKILEQGERLLEEARSLYEDARTKNSVGAFIDAGFKLEETRIKFIVLQEIGSPENQKLAGDRLRAINQLGKLIHDGKVALVGTPADSPTPKTPETPAAPSAKSPTSEPVPSPRPPVDVMKRSPVPDAARQREAEKAVKELFRDNYAKKGPGDRQALAKILLDQAEKTRDDPAGLWVLLREALDAAVQCGDVRLAGVAIEATAHLFDVDALSMKTASFLAAAKVAKTPAEFAVQADVLLGVIDELIGTDQYDLADKCAAAAVQQARRSNDNSLVLRVSASLKEVAEAKSKFQAMKGALETLAKTPEDPGANRDMGQFLCFVKGDWDLGLRFMAKGSDAGLKALAEKELAFPVQPAERAAVADAWYELGDKEKSPLCKRQLLLHAKNYYESAVLDATGLLRARIEKRLDTLQSFEAVSGGTITDITTLTPKRSSVGYFTLGINSNVNHCQVFVNGKVCKQYLFAHAPSSLVYEIPARSKTFLATGVKLDKNAAHVAGTWKYLVVIDGKTVYDSKPLNEVKGFELEMSVPIPAGAKEIELKVDPLGDYTSDWATWAYPRFQK